MPSPLCQVKEGAGAWQATAGGVNVTAGATITIDLVDKTVRSWTVACISTDDLSSASTPNTAIAGSINAITKQATFTAPTNGRTYRFRSTVDGGVDLNGVSRPSYSTTFCVYVPTVTGDRVHAADETTEGDSSFGWLATLNALVRGAQRVSAGTTGARPASPATGQMYFDTTLGKPIWWGGAAWKYADGTAV